MTVIDCGKTFLKSSIWDKVPQEVPLFLEVLKFRTVRQIQRSPYKFDPFSHFYTKHYTCTHRWT